MKCDITKAENDEGREKQLEMRRVKCFKTAKILGCQ